MKTKICVITSSRADYGLLKNLIKKLKNSNVFNLQLIVTGSHLSEKHGFSINEILNDRLRIDKKIKIIGKTDTHTEILKNVTHATDKMLDALSQLNPKMVIILGDRYEIFSTATAAAFLQIPIAHIHGGEITEGAIDDMLRHVITKFSNLHFTSTIDHQKRVIQLGENPKNVFNVGALGVENIIQTKLKSLSSLQSNIDFKFRERNILVTYHPVTLDENPILGIDILLRVLDKFKNVGMIFSYANADILGSEITEKITYFQNNRDNVKIYKNLGQTNYLSCLKYCDGIVGNSSSGIIEAPSMKKWSINIGDRQKNRTKAKSIFDVPIDEKKIFNKLNLLLSKKKIVHDSDFINPYYKKNTSSLIYKTLVKFSKEKIANKKFYDVNFKF